MSRVGLGRHGQLDSDAGDPLDGLVNMFDLGLVLAVAFLVAGLTLSGQAEPHRAAEDGNHRTDPQDAVGEPVGIGTGSCGRSGLPAAERPARAREAEDERALAAGSPGRYGWRLRVNYCDAAGRMRRR